MGKGNFKTNVFKPKVDLITGLILAQYSKCNSGQVYLNVRNKNHREWNSNGFTGLSKDL